MRSEVMQMKALQSDKLMTNGSESEFLNIV